MLSKEEIIKRANNYIDFMKKEIKENKNCFGNYYLYSI